jgi:Tfp pilus assembly protein PilF
MSFCRYFLFVPVLILSLILGCAHFEESGTKESKPQEAPPQTPFSLAVKSYEGGNYKKALTEFKEVIKLPDLSLADQIQVHKYLAFINCLTNKSKRGIIEFKKALELDPKFELTPAEAGHPMWGQVFKKAKAEMEASKSQQPAKPGKQTKEK